MPRAKALRWGHIWFQEKEGQRGWSRVSADGRKEMAGVKAQVKYDPGNDWRGWRLL